MSKDFRGIFTALLTPFGSDWKINENVLAAHIEENIRKGVTGFYVNGSTSEVFLLTEDERKHLYRFVKETVGDRCTLIAHIGAVSTLQTIEYGQLAARLGYDAVSSVSPFYYGFTPEEIRQHYFMTAEQVPLPNPRYTTRVFRGNWV